MSKAIQGAAELAGAIGMGALAAMDPALLANPFYLKAMEMLVLTGIATEAGAIAQAIGSKSGLGITTRTPAAFRQIIRGIQRVGGTIVYQSTTGSTKRQYNMVIVIAGHPCYALENLYLDGRQVFWDTSSSYNQTVNGYNFGGNADGNSHTGPNGVQYNFGGLVFCAAFQGNQTSDPTVVDGSWVGPPVIDSPTQTYPGFCSALQANDGTWSAGSVPVGAPASGYATLGAGGSIASLTLSGGGWGYADGDVAVTITDASGSGTGATAHGVAFGGSVTSLVLDSGGTGYEEPNVTIAPGSTTINTPYLGGCTYVYLKIEADAGTFPQFPEIKFTVHGKSDIYDPRTGTRGYTSNWALHVADVLSDPTWGLGDTSINEDQLIAAANVCDELVSCAAGSESQFALHYHCDASMSPGDQLATMMRSKEGRLSRIGGEWYIWPPYWQGPSFTFDENALLDAIQWTSTRPLSDLCNRVTGTYIAPNFPFNVAGNLYDSNGFWNGQTQNNFPFSFQPTDYPEYAADALHGYGEDVYLIADTPNLGAWSSAQAYNTGDVVIYGGVPWQALEPNTNQTPSSTSTYWVATGNYLPHDLPQECTLSISEAQRVAKIHMERNRQQGSGTLTMSLAAFAMQPIDVMQFDMPAMGWTNKLLEIAGAPGMKYKLRFAVSPGAQQGNDEEEQTPAVFVEVPVNETDPSVYEWDYLTEELTPYDVQAFGGQVNTWTVAPPTGVTATSDLSTALVQPDGTVIPRIEMQWSAPADTYVTNGGSIRIQITPHGTGAWQDVLLLGGTATAAFLGNVVSGAAYDVRIAAVRSSGAQSAWVELDDVVCGFALSSSDLLAVAPAGTLTAITVSGVSTILVANFTASYYGLTASVTGGSVTGLTPSKLYYVYYVDTSFAGGSVTFYATQNQGDFIGKPGYFLVGSVITPSGSSATVYAPSNYVDGGTAASDAPGVAYGDYAIPGGGAYGPTAEVTVQGYGNPLVPDSAYGQLLYEDFPAVTSISGQNLYVIASVASTPGTSDPAVTAAWAITACLGGGMQPSGQLGTLNSRGAWAASTAYAQWDTFTESGATYLVVTGYTSGSSFGSTDTNNCCLLLASGAGGSVSTATYSVPVPAGISLGAVTVTFTANAVTNGGWLHIYIGDGSSPSIYIQ